jgi:CMP-N-acetylneuraminic acid synthetase
MPKIERCLAIIPARGGSKRLPRKNVLDLAGKPLIAHSIEAALASGCFGTVLVTTDDPEIAAVASRYPGVVVDARDPDLAGDTVKVVAVVTELCSRPDIHSRFDAIGVMLPTAPFRRVRDIQAGFAALSDDIDAVVSFAPYEFPPTMAVTLEGEARTMKPLFNPSPLITGNTRSQDQAASYRPNGSFYFTWIASFLKLGSFYTGKVSGVVMTRLGSSDIDEKDDFELARLIVAAGLSESDFA